MKQLTDEVFAQVREALEIANANNRRNQWSTLLTDAALAALDTAQPEPVNAMLVDALEQAKRWHQGDKWRDDPDNRSVWEDHMTVLNTAIAAAQQAQPERAPLSDAELEQEFCNIAGLETGINPAAADTKRALVWFKKGYAHGIKQGGQHD